MIEDLIIGTDLVFIPRLADSYQRYGATFFQKLLTNNEWHDCHIQSGNSRLKKRLFHKVAGRIAIKEAVAKALGVGLNGLGWNQGISWKEIEVIHIEKQAPQLRLHAKALDIANRQTVNHWRFSISHDGQYAMATVIGLMR